jgi:hypothetical protein
MPFVVGILGSSLEEVLNLPMDEVLIVDCDNNSFLLKPGDDLALLPPNLWMPLKQMLSITRKDIRRMLFGVTTAIGVEPVQLLAYVVREREREREKEGATAIE